MTKNVLITGGAGFIGGHLAESFVADGHDVTVLDNFEPFYTTALKDHNVAAGRAAAARSPGSYTLVRGDIRDESTVRELADAVDYVYHQAAQAGVRNSVDKPGRFNDINVNGTLNVLDAARDAGVDRVIVASSSSVYGKPRALPYDESHPTTPVSPYGASKLAAEQYAHAYNHVYGLPAVALRYFTVYGPRMRPNMAISNFITRCLVGEPLVVNGDGSQTRDFTYIADVVRANKRLLETDAADGAVLNIGSTETIEIRELASVVRELIDPGVRIEFDDRHPADADHTKADVSKAAGLIGYDPAVPIQAGIKKTVNWFRDNSRLYETEVLA